MGAIAGGVISNVEVRTNLAASQAVSRNSVDGCPFCERVGFPILPVRYAVIPNYLDSRRGSASPQALLSQKNSAFGEVAGLGRHSYTMRTLREGFVYIYLNRPGQWQVYSVTARGNLRLLPDPDDIDEKSSKEMSTQCMQAGHNVPASFIHIQDPSRTPVVWVAFSTARWTAAVRSRYESAPAMRMQRFDVGKLMVGADKEKDAFEISEGSAALLTGRVEEYLANGDEADQRTGYTSAKIGDLSSEKFNWESVHCSSPSVGHASALQTYALNYQRLSGQSRKVAAIVLNDAMGITQELEASRLHAVESMQTYAAKWTRANTVSQSILGLKKIIEHSALAARTVDESSKGIPDSVTVTTVIPDDLPSQATRIESTTTREQRAQNDSRKIWSDLEGHYDEAKRASFQSTYDQVMAAFSSQIRQCDEDLAAWFVEPSWHAWMNDYDSAKFSECARFVNDYAACIAGGAVGEKTEEVWKAWFEGNPSMSGNPVYKALFFNQPSLLESLVPADGSVNKGDKLYDTIRALMTSEEFSAHVTPKVVASIAIVQTAITGALAQVGAKLATAGTALSSRAMMTALRAQQGVVLLYQKVEMTLLRVQMTVGEYQRLLGHIAFLGRSKVGDVVQDFTDAAGKKVRSVLLSGTLNLNDARVRDTIIEVVLWSYEAAEDLQRQVDGALNDIRNAAGRFNDQISDEMRRATAGLSSRLSVVRLEGALIAEAMLARISGLRSGVALSSQAALQLARSMANKSLRVAGNGNVILAAGALFFQSWSLRDSLRAADATLGRSGEESQLAFLSPAIGVLGASSEVLGFALKALGKSVGEKFIGGGGVVAALASLVDSASSWFAATRSFRAGDRDAALWHGVAAAVFLMGGLVGAYAAFGAYVGIAGSAALAGPLGIALGLIAIGVLVSWYALTAEDTQSAIWLDRCYFGYGKRREGKWADDAMAEELAGLNAIVVGVSAKLIFSDSWLGLAEQVTGYERLDLEIRIAGLDVEKAGYEWQLFGEHNEKGEILLVSGRLKVPAPPQYMSAASKRMPSWMLRDDPQKWIREITVREYSENGVKVICRSVEVLRKHFKKARVKVDYWPDFSDDETRATLEVKDED